ncbi:hypothetical protein B0H14DRAFT_2590045 [Mycena olivaceomarginata]|nr:hypothetical protein B0H14DRAFT_2590045 [Mycena olivaceomarginata]
MLSLDFDPCCVEFRLACHADPLLKELPESRMRGDMAVISFFPLSCFFCGSLLEKSEKELPSISHAHSHRVTVRLASHPPTVHPKLRRRLSFKVINSVDIRGRDMPSIAHISAFDFPEKREETQSEHTERSRAADVHSNEKENQPKRERLSLPPPHKRVENAWLDEKKKNPENATLLADWNSYRSQNPLDACSP